MAVTAGKCRYIRIADTPHESEKMQTFHFIFQATSKILAETNKKEYNSSNWYQCKFCNRREYK